MAKYVDGFVLVVPKDKSEEYKKMAEIGRDAWLKHGALSYFECIGDDLVAKEMGGEKPVEFTKLTGAEPGDNVWFSFIVFKSKKHRDEVNARVFEEMEKQMAEYKDIPMPFDMKKMASGGFEVAVEG